MSCERIAYLIVGFVAAVCVVLYFTVGAELALAVWLSFFALALTVRAVQIVRRNGGESR